MGLKRRDFLRGFGWTLAALGVSQSGLLRMGDRYYQALAQPSPRKLALLVGINQYPHTALAGCLTDVELQRELLIHRFGFKEGDILTLTEQQATRQQIEIAFLKHLTEQAQPGDVVVFHFSGYGRRVQLKTSSDVLNTLVPADGVVPTSDALAVNDLLEETLWLLMQSLPTDRVTAILDTSFSHPGSSLQGNLRVRARPQMPLVQMNAEELDFQAQLRRQIEGSGRLVGATPDAIDTIPGVVLAAAGSTQQATEGQWAGFSAGVFTYALTQYLWEATPATTIQVSLNRVAGVVEQLGGKQQPALSGQNSQERALLAYHLMPDRLVGSDGVVMAVENDGKTGQLWLAGLPPKVLEYYGVNSQLILVPPSPARVETADAERFPSNPVPNQPLKLQVRSRAGLTAKAQIASNDNAGALQVGQLVQESVRVLPRNIGLVIALDAGLERIERVDATSAFATVPYVSVVVAGEQSADYLFGRVQESQDNASSASSTSRYGLFSLSQELIPNTAGEAGEAVKVAVQRMVPKLQTLLAVKLWRLTMNEGSSRLNVKAKLEVIANQERVLIQRETLRPSLQNAKDLSGRLASEAKIPTLPTRSRIQYQVYNDSNRPVYLVLLGLDTSKNAIALYSTQPKSEPNDTPKKPAIEDLVIAPGETLTVPKPLAFEWIIHRPIGLAETYLIFSSAPFTQTRAALEAAMPSTEDAEGVGELRNPLEVAQAVLQDLHQASAVKAENIGVAADSLALDVDIWASLSFIYEVV